MNPQIFVRSMTPSDLPFADSLRALAGWNQTMADWKRLLMLSPRGCFVAEWNGYPAGTVTTISYGGEVAWIGMLLVHPDFRRRGVGQTLLSRCLDTLVGRGINCIKLDATPEGQPLYQQCGFQAEWCLTRWTGDRSCAIGNRPSPLRNAPLTPLPSDGRGEPPWERENLRSSGGEPDPASNLEMSPPQEGHQRQLRPFIREYSTQVADLDREAFGVHRQTLLEHLVQSSRSALVAESDGGITGYGVLREGAHADYLGPIASASPQTARRLAEALLASRRTQRPVYWDIPDQNVEAVALAKEFGFVAQRRLTRMFLGTNQSPGNVRRYFAIAEPALG